jgi:acyl-CoA thioesterase FadM
LWPDFEIVGDASTRGADPTFTPGLTILALQRSGFWGMSGDPAVDGRIGGSFLQGTQVMTDWTETYRGTVPPWQCDVTEHFTIAYYFDRLEEAEANFADELGLGDLPGRGDLVRRLDVRFARELRAGSSFHVESAALGVDAQGTDSQGTHAQGTEVQRGDNGLRLGHRFVDSATGEVVTWIDEHWDLSTAPLTPRQRQTIGGRLAAWNGPAAEPRPEPVATAGFIPTARGRVKPGDLDAAGHFALAAIVHRFSNASGQAGAAVGMDADFMEQHRRGFSTFELTLRISGALRLNEPYLVETGIGHLGNSSLRLIHSMTNPRNGTEVARLGQFGVNLDLDARRPARWPDDIRGRAAALVVPVA